MPPHPAHGAGRGGAGGGGGAPGDGPSVIAIGSAAVALPARSVIVIVYVAADRGHRVPLTVPLAGSSASPAGSAGATEKLGMPVRAKTGVRGPIGWPTQPAIGA